MPSPSKRTGGIVGKTLLVLALICLLSHSLPTANAQSVLLNAVNSNTTAPAEKRIAAHLQVTATLHSGGGVDLHWDCDLPDAAQFRVERSNHGLNQWTEVATVAAAGFSDPQGNSTLVDYRVLALDKEGKILDTSATISPLKNNLLNIFNGGVVTLRDMQDFKFWQGSVNTIVLGTLSFIPKLLAAIILFGIFWVFYRIVRRIIIGSMSRTTSIPAFVTCSPPSCDGPFSASPWSSPAMRSASKSPPC